MNPGGPLKPLHDTWHHNYTLIHFNWHGHTWGQFRGHSEVIHDCDHWALLLGVQVWGVRCCGEIGGILPVYGPVYGSIKVQVMEGNECKVKWVYLKISLKSMLSVWVRYPMFFYFFFYSRGSYLIRYLLRYVTCYLFIYIINMIFFSLGRLSMMLINK